MSPPVATVQVPVRGLRVQGRCFRESVPTGAEFLITGIRGEFWDFYGFL